MNLDYGIGQVINVAGQAFITYFTNTGAFQ